MPTKQKRAKYKQQQDRYLKTLSEQERRIQQHIRKAIILLDTEYLWRC